MILQILIRVSLCLVIFLLGISITMRLALLSVRHHGTSDPEHSFYHDEDGLHVYYDRSLIEKINFLRRHPSIPLKSIRSLKRLFTD